MENALINHHVFKNLFVDECTTIDWMLIYVMLNRQPKSKLYMYGDPC